MKRILRLSILMSLFSIASFVTSSYVIAACLSEQEFFDNDEWASIVADHLNDAKIARTYTLIIEHVQTDSLLPAGRQKVANYCKVNLEKSLRSGFSRRLNDVYNATAVETNTVEIKKILSDLQTLGIQNLSSDTVAQLKFKSINYLIKLNATITINLYDNVAYEAVSIHTEMLEITTRAIKFIKDIKIASKKIEKETEEETEEETAVDFSSSKQEFRVGPTSYKVIIKTSITNHLDKFYCVRADRAAALYHGWMSEHRDARRDEVLKVVWVFPLTGKDVCIAPEESSTIETSIDLDKEPGARRMYFCIVPYWKLGDGTYGNSSQIKYYTRIYTKLMDRNGQCPG